MSNGLPRLKTSLRKAERFLTQDKQNIIRKWSGLPKQSVIGNQPGLKPGCAPREAARYTSLPKALRRFAREIRPNTFCANQHYSLRSTGKHHRGEPRVVQRPVPTGCSSCGVRVLRTALSDIEKQEAARSHPTAWWPSRPRIRHRGCSL